MCRPRIAVALLVAVACTCCAARVYATAAIGGNLGREIRKRYQGKLLLLNAPSCFDLIHFDVNGQSTRPFGGQPWTTCGMLRAAKIDVRNRQMILDGQRVIVAFDPHSTGEKLYPLPTERGVHIIIEMPALARNDNALSEFLSRIFFAGDMTKRISNAWHADVDLRREITDISALPPDGRIGTLEGMRPVYYWESGVVTRPKAVYKPAPSYPANLFRKKVSGTIRVRVIVNENGYPEILEIVQHLREGLDARALSAVSQWRFERPLKDGVAAATMVVVELKFHLPGKKMQIPQKR